jgi:hypothetical protein
MQNPSASLLRDWVEAGTFTWLVTEEILSEYKGVLGKLGVRRHLVGEIINLLREEAEFVPIRSEDNLSPRSGRQRILRLRGARACRVHCHVEQETFPSKEPDR